MNTPSGTFRIKAFNPYVARFPDRKVVSGDTLTLIKILREQGITVVVEPEDERPLQYLFQKGIQEFFSDPVLVFCVGIPVGIACNLISNAIDRAWHRHRVKTGAPQPPAKLGVFIKGDQSTDTFSPTGATLEPKWVKHMLATGKEARKSYREARSRKSPYPNLPSPLFVEHVPRTVGWCALDLNEKGLLLREAKITDKATQKKIKDGVLKGLSVGGIAEVSTCSVCREDYTACNHISGEDYNGQNCINHLERQVLADVSLVRTPVNPECLLRIQS